MRENSQQVSAKVAPFTIWLKASAGRGAKYSCPAMNVARPHEKA
jgi:hypothetical protein